MFEKAATSKRFREFRDAASLRDASGRFLTVAVEIVVSGTSSTDRKERVLEIDYLLPVPASVNLRSNMTDAESRDFLNNFLVKHMADVSIKS